MQLKMLSKVGYHRNKTQTSKKKKREKGAGQKKQREVEGEKKSSNRIFAEKSLKHEEKGHR